MKILNVVTTHRPFFVDQCRAIRSCGVELDTIRVPGPESTAKSRSFSDYIKFYINIIRKVSARDYDLIHANFGNTIPFAICQPNRPVIATLWGSDIMRENEGLRKFIKCFSKRCDTVVLPSKKMASYYPSDHKYIPFGVDTEKFKPFSQTKAREKVGWNQYDDIVLFPYPGNRKVKNYSLARKVVSKLEGTTLKRLDGISHDRVSLYMNAADALLVTSKRESGPMVIKEAALCNLPVISTDVGFASDILSDIKNSFVCGSFNELVEKLQNVIHSSSRSDGHKYMKKWGLTKMGNEYLNVYKSTINQYSNR